MYITLSVISETYMYFIGGLRNRWADDVTFIMIFQGPVRKYHLNIFADSVLSMIDDSPLHQIFQQSMTMKRKSVVS